MIRLLLAACLALFALPSLAGNWPQLKMAAEHPIEGMRGGNLAWPSAEAGYGAFPTVTTTAFTGSINKMPCGALNR